VPDNAGVDLIGDHQDQRRRCLFERSLDRPGVEKPDGDVNGLAVPAPAVRVNFARVHDRAQPYPQGRLLVVFDEQRRQQRYQPVEQDRLGYLVVRPDEHEDAVATIGELLQVIVGYRRRFERVLEQVVHDVPQLALDGVGARGRSLEIEGDDRPVERAGWPPAVK
jgi:hypothetical protein